MTVTVERRAPGRVERLAYESPLWLPGVATLVGATLLHGYRQSGAMHGVMLVARDPFTELNTAGPWMYQSPVGPMLAWALHLRSGDGVALVHYAITALIVVGVPYLVARWHSDFAGRLWLVAFWCSPQSWAAVASLGLFDIITVAGITVCVVAPVGACLAAGVLLGFNHFEQALFALVGVAVIRCVLRREPRGPVVAGFVGLLLGKAALMVYLMSAGIETNGRIDFIRDVGLADIIHGWTGHILTLEWAVYNVLWVGVIWMLWTMRREDRARTIGLHLFLTLPVLLTYDLSRVYRTVTWPIVMLLVLYAAEWEDRRLVRVAALWLVAAAVFVPRTEIWHGGLRING